MCTNITFANLTLIDVENGEPFHPQNHVGRVGGGLRNGAMGAVRLPKILEY